jgi:ribonucleoside-diphosphate reductase alpha chain
MLYHNRNPIKMFVIKRDGRHEEMKFDKITKRVKILCNGLNMDFVNPSKVTQKVSAGITDMITTQELDGLASNVASDMILFHPDYGILAGRIAVSNLRKQIKKTFSGAMCELYNNTIDGEHTPLISIETWDIIQKHKVVLDDAIIHHRDMQYNIFGFATLKGSYFLRAGDRILETPQYMHMRVSIGIIGDKIGEILALYTMLSKRLYTHSTPTIFNAGTTRPQMASCFLVAMKGDSIEGIFDTVKECAIISKYAGGVGLHAHNIRPMGSHIKGTNGTSSGLVPFLRIFNETALAVNQASKRKGAFAIYLEMHHPDIEHYVELRKNNGAEELRTRDLFIALWMSDHFMDRLDKDGIWSLFDPNKVPGLSDAFGQQYVTLYEKYEAEGRATKVVSARDLWIRILNSQIETGTPYIINKDQVNLKSNQGNLGTIKSSNLCAEVVQYSSPEETAVCNLASLCLPRFFKEGNGPLEFDFTALSDMAGFVTKNLNYVIDRSFYPVETARVSNMKHRPLGIGVSGLHDVFLKLKLSFDSTEAKLLNKQIFETIYRGAIKESIQLAKRDGPYESWTGSPTSRGVFQFDMCEDFDHSLLMWEDWDTIRADMVKYGLRNSLLIALMPTATSATIVGVTESFEIQTSNLYSRRVLSGQFTIINRCLVSELIELGLWCVDIAHTILANKGSVSNIMTIPADVRARYRTVWEYSMKDVIDMAADRAPFVCQSQSMNLYIKRPSVRKMNSMLKHAHSRKLKTMMYYLRTKSTADPIQFTVKDQATGDAEECTSCSA